MGGRDSGPDRMREESNFVPYPPYMIREDFGFPVQDSCREELFYLTR
jgi:hypothetical protein